MERWTGKVALITGASSGIGEELVLRLARHGLVVVGLARRLERMQEISNRLKDAKGTFHPIRCDITKEEDILEAFQFAKSLGGVDILINNAATVFRELIIDGTTQNFQSVIDTNLLATAICTREATRSMRERHTEGHVINISSIAGQNVHKANAPLNLYQPTKCAVTALSEVIRNELTVVKAPIKVTNFTPGLVKTDMPRSVIEIKDVFEFLPYLETKDVVDAIVFILGTPPNVQVDELTLTSLHEGSPKISTSTGAKS